MIPGVVLVVLVTATAYLQPVAVAAPTRNQVLSAAREVMQKARYCSLVTIGADGHPQARIVDPLGPDDAFTVWVATNPLTRKVAEVKRDPRVTLICFETGSESYVTVLAQASIVTDPDEKARRWKNEWTPFYSRGAAGDDVTLIRLAPRRLEIVSVARGMAGDPKTWRPLAVEFP